jgi:hypothetical protein
MLFSIMGHVSSSIWHWSSTPWALSCGGKAGVLGALAQLIVRAGKGFGTYPGYC